MVDPKPGYKTTEFWLSSFAVVMGLVISSDLLSTLPPDSMWVRVVAIVISGLTVLGYTGKRTEVKK